MKLHKILITGASGQLGADCMHILSKHYEVIGFSHNQLDIANEEAVKRMLFDVRPDIIINCAAFTQVDDCETMTDKAFQINADGPHYLAIHAQKLGAKLVHISTDYVFDGRRPVPEKYIETDPVNPLTVYGKSKYKGEAAIIKETDRFMIIRTAWLFGIHGKNFLKTIYGLAINKKLPTLKVVNTQTGSFTHTHDLAQQIHRMIQADAQGIYHASGEGYCTWYEGACYFFNTMGIDTEIIPCTEKEFPTKAIRPKNSILSNKRLIDENIHEMPHWKQSIDDFVDLFKKELG